MSENVVWIAEAQIKEGQRDAFEAVRNDLVEATSKEEGALNYEWHLSEDGTDVWIYERYEDLDAAITHLSTWEQHAGRFIAAADFTRLIVCSDLPPELRERLSGINCAYRIPWGGFKQQAAGHLWQRAALGRSFSSALLVSDRSIK